MMQPYFTNDAIVLGLLLSVLSFVFFTSTSKNKWIQKFYTVFPPLLLCYFLPALLHWPLNLISGENSVLYKVSSQYFLPASLILLCLSIDLKGVWNLGPKALIMFLTGSLGVIIGGPIALLTVKYLFPDLIQTNPEDLWRGLSSIAGSWIGGGANQTAMKEIFSVNENLFAVMIVVDVVVANVWMGLLLYGASITDKLDKWLKADTSAIVDLQNKMSAFQKEVERIPDTKSLLYLLTIAFAGVALSHWGADLITPWLGKYKEVLISWRLTALNSSFFWIAFLATTIGLIFSFTRLRNFEGIGASRLGSIFLYILVATIGMQMNLQEVFQNLGLFAVGFIWMSIHCILLILVARWIKAPFFFLAVGSQANIGGAASAPIVAAAISPALAPVGVLLAVLGYALGTYGALLCAFLMQLI
ncbi:MAG: DUF819 family protein [Saprospiraceae bacterium]|nr:DUF819 family protein [Saprospiraceae bacterium]MDP4699800.1 DUF819 family protein [Saprospiraceae bacterium]MDP4810836.1 DUF819 family protein [Saprospiraceae bacterium]MDP4815212.1 DUF819 family protein [Saprospiraceae bacterium]MDP4851960.1 DUF819 family protein [Saprospiraceae bacterium]